MSAPQSDNDPFKAEDVLAVMQALSIAEKKRLARALDSTKSASNPLWDVGYIAIPKRLLDTMSNIVSMLTRKWTPAIFKVITDLDKQLSKMKRKPDKERLERGKIISQAHKDGISWKNMPAHVLKNYADWFPEYKDKPPAMSDKKRLEDTLRKMARDAEKRRRPESR